MDRLSHVDHEGRAKMVDVGAKRAQRAWRTPSARLPCRRTRGYHPAKPDSKGGRFQRGAVGHSGRQTHGELIPLCHPLALDKIDVRLELTEQGVTAKSEVCCVGRTGVEMEALVAVSVALLTVYDMCKAVDDVNAHPTTFRWSRRSKAMSRSIEVVSVNVSEQKGTVKLPAPEIAVDASGVVGDAHAGAWHRQVSLLDLEHIDRFAREIGRTIQPGEFGEKRSAVPERGRVTLLDRFRLSDVELEVTQIGPECQARAVASFSNSASA